MRRFLCKCLLIVTVFICCQWLVRQQIPYYYWENLEKQQLIPPKINYLKTHPDLNTLFIGSSQVYHHIVPEIFDQHTGLNSMNLGINGMMLFEASYFLEQLLANEQMENIKYICFEVPTTSQIASNNLRPIRPHYFFDPQRTLLALHYFWTVNATPQLKNTLESFFRRCFGYGNLLRLQKWYQSATEEKMNLPNKGYTGLNAFFKEKKDFVHCDDIAPFTAHPILMDELKRLYAKCAVQKIEFIPIYIHESYRCNSLEEDSLMGIILGDFGDYEAYTDPTNWFGPGHLNDEGGKRFTTHFATYFSEKILK